MELPNQPVLQKNRSLTTNRVKKNKLDRLISARPIKARTFKKKLEPEPTMEAPTAVDDD
jgi:hypothetical protein